MKRNGQAAVDQFEIFKHLEPHVLESIRRISVVYQLADQELLYQPAQHADSFYIVQSGGIRLLETTEEGKLVNIKVYGAGDIFGLLAISGHFWHHGAAQAVGTSEVAAFQGDQARELMLVYPRFALTIIDLLVEHVNHAHGRIRHLAAEKVERRLARALLHFHDKFGKDHSIGIGQQDLAEFTGTTIETVNRTLRQWEQHSIIQRSRLQIEIHQREQLEAIADGGDSQYHHYEDIAGA